MHLVFLNQYYPPDAAPTGVMLEAVVDRLVEQGHQVTVICAEGGYAGGNIEHRTSNIEHRSEEASRGASANAGDCSSSPHFQNSKFKIQNPESSVPSSSVARLPASRFGRGTFVGKLADYASYYLGAAWKLMVMHPRPDRIIALTTPPYLSVLARLISKLRGADHAHWVMDLYPDVMVAHGMLAEGGWKHRLLAGLASWGFGGGRCAVILTLGPDMADRVKKVISDQSSVISEEESGDAQAPPPTADRQPPTVSWVPLWGSGEGGAVGRGWLAEGGGPVGLDRRAGPVVANGADGEGEAYQLAVGGGRLAENEPPSFPIQNPKSALRAKRGWRDDELVVMYSGNMGLGHRFGEILEAAKRLNIEHRTSNIERRNEENLSVESVTGGILSSSAPNQKPKIINHQSSISSSPSIRFVFYGAGKRRGEIENFMREHAGCAVELDDYAPADELAEHLLSADVHLASLDAAWTGTMVPSKLQGIFAVGRPVIFVGSPESSIGRWVVQSGGGWVVEPDDVDGLLAALDEAGDPDVRTMRGTAAGEFAKEHFDREINAARVAEIFTR